MNLWRKLGYMEVCRRTMAICNSMSMRMAKLDACEPNQNKEISYLISHRERLIDAIRDISDLWVRDMFLMAFIGCLIGLMVGVAIGKSL